jgi:hypothetical protein
LLNEAYLRTGWYAHSLLVAIRTGRVSVYCGPHLVYEDLTPARLVDVAASQAAGTGIYRYEPPGLATVVTAVGGGGAGQWAHDSTAHAASTLSVTLDDRQRTVVIRRADGVRRRWACDPSSGVDVVVARGSVVNENAAGHRPDFSAGYGLLAVIETDPRSYHTTTAVPEDGQLVLAITVPPRHARMADSRRMRRCDLDF